MFGRALVGALNLSWPGLESAKAFADAGDLGAACDAVASYYAHSNTSSWLRIGPVTPGTGTVGGDTDAAVFNDTFTGFPSPSGPVKMLR